MRMAFHRTALENLTSSEGDEFSAGQPSIQKVEPLNPKKERCMRENVRYQYHIKWPLLLYSNKVQSLSLGFQFSFELS